MSYEAETILINHHDPVVRRLVCRALVPEGYRIAQVSSPEDAVRTAARHTSHIDLLFTEAFMASMRGWDLADLLRLDYPSLKAIYMSYFVDAAIRAHARQSGLVV